MVRFSSFWVGYLLFSTTKGYQITSKRDKIVLFNLKNRKKISPGKLLSIVYIEVLLLGNFVVSFILWS